MKRGSRVFCFLIPLFVFAAAARAEGPATDVSVAYSLPRNYGFFLGDLIEISYAVRLPPGRVLHPEPIPGEGSPGSFEIKRRKIEQRERRSPESYVIDCVYQVFSAGEEARPFEIPGMRLAYGPKQNPAAGSFSLPAVPVIISPLAAPGAPFQPFILWRWASPTPFRLRLAGLALLLSGTIPFFFWERKRLRIHSPFRTAGKKISREKDPATALILFRQALNEKTGKAVFGHNLADFFASFPRAREYEPEVREIVGLSDEVIFNPQNSIPREGLVSRICVLTDRLRRAEKWE